jgi:hypothetical protein
MARAVRFSVTSLCLALVAVPGLAASSAAHPPHMGVLVDSAPPLLTVARELTREAGLDQGIEFREGSALQLPFPDGTFDAVACNGWLVRQLPLLLQRAGIVDVGVRGFFPLETELRSLYGGMAERCAEVAVKVGALSEFERRAWLDAFHERGAEGPVIAGRLRVFVWGRKE